MFKAMLVCCLVVGAFSFVFAQSVTSTDTSGKKIVIVSGTVSIQAFENPQCTCLCTGIKGKDKKNYGIAFSDVINCTHQYLTTQLVPGDSITVSGTYDNFNEFIRVKTFIVNGKKFPLPVPEK